MKSKIFYILICSGLLFACDDVPQEDNPLEKNERTQMMEKDDEDLDGTVEKVVDTYEDGQKKTVVVYAENGATRLEERMYFPTGELQIEGEYLNDKRHGKWMAYYKDGTEWSENNYKDGEYHGPYKQWYPNGQLRVSGQYVEGKEVGEWLFYDEEGNIATVEEF